jgi:PAS domain S-box-containing protein
MKLTIRRLGLSLAIAPTVIAFVSSVKLNELLQESRAEASQAAQSERVFQLNDQLIAEISSLIMTIEQDQRTTKSIGDWTTRFNVYSKDFSTINEHIDELKKLVQDDPEQLQLALEIQDSWQRMLKAIEETRTAFENNDLRGIARGNMYFRHTMQKIWFQTKFPNLFQIAARERARAQQRTEQEAKLRDTLSWVILIFVAVEVIFAAVFAVVALRTVGKRLLVLKDNSMRLASNRDLNPVLTGSDELAELDRVFHAMADGLKEASRREQALIENAADAICSLNKDLRITNANPAASELFGRASEDLIGQNVLVLLDERARAQAQSEFERAIESAQVGKFDLTCRRADGALKEAVWSVQWSKANSALVCIVHDVSELRAAERMKQDLVRMITHDIRSPLQAVSAFLELLHEGMIADVSEKGEKLLENAETSATMVMDLLSDFLDLEKLQSGTMVLNPRPTAVDALFDDARSAVAWAAKQGVTVKAATTGLAVMADRRRVAQVLVNLIGNAVKFSPRGSCVTLDAHQENSHVEITVEDQGRGIPADKIDSLFNNFEQVHADDSANKRGAGLGLSICKAIVTQHGGTIGAQSEVGTGSTFWFRLNAAAITDVRQEDKQPGRRERAASVAHHQAASVETSGRSPEHSGKQRAESAPEVKMETPNNAGPEPHDANGTSPPAANAKAAEPDEQESSMMHVFLLGVGSVALVAGAIALIMTHQQTVDSAKTEQEAARPSAANPDPAAPPTVAGLIKDGELNLQDRIELTDQDLLCLKNLRTIKSLNLTGCGGLTDASMDTIVSLPLTSLYVYGTKFTPTAFKKLSSLGSLQTLNAGGSDFDDSDVAAVSQIKTLTELRLPRCPRITPAALQSIQTMTWLEKLALPGDNVRDSLSSLGSLHLTLLNLAADKVSNDDINMLCQRIRTLSTLNIRDNPVGDPILADGSPLSTLPGLTNLSILDTQISHTAGEKFASKHKSCKVSMSEPGEPKKTGRANS